MRDILFRGKRLDNGEWVEGYYVEKKDPLLESDVRNAFILAQARGDSFVTWFPVDPSTVGQFTGLLDKNGKRIFEGDIVHILGNQDVDDWKSVDYNALIAFLDGGFCAIDGTIEDHAFRRYALMRMDFELEIIGNIHDNPELLEVTPGA